MLSVFDIYEKNKTNEAHNHKLPTNHIMSLPQIALSSSSQDKMSSRPSGSMSKNASKQDLRVKSVTGAKSPYSDAKEDGYMQAKLNNLY